MITYLGSGWLNCLLIMYYNYHARAKALISEGHLIRMEIVERWNAISPALVLYFDNHRPMPIREYRWDEYLQFGEVDNEQYEKAQERAWNDSSRAC